MAAAALIIAIFFVIIVVTISFEAVFKNESEKNLNEGIKKGEENKTEFPPPELENPKSN
jgi:hypothetical protein